MARRHTILVGDDEPDVVQSVQDLLRLDYKVLGATRAEDGMRLLGEQEVHVVMTDQRMPETTGVEFLHQIRGAHPDAVRLLFTGYADIRAVIDAINQGNVYRYITKPWDPDELQSIIREATERYDLMVERKRLIGELQDKNRELEQAYRGLQEASDLKTAFIQVASHELRTPLTILLGLTKLAESVPDVPDPLPDWLRRMNQGAERLQRLINQIITMLAAGRYDQALDRHPTDLADLLCEATDDVRPFVALRRQTLDLEMPKDLGAIALDASKIRDSLDHLLLNAIKFTPDGGRILVSAEREANGDARIRVRDSGAGIDPTDLPRLFEPFFTSFDVSRHSSGHYEYNRKGLGLGLSVVKAFTEMHGGGIEVERTGPDGTTFLITLPDRNG